MVYDDEAGVDSLCMGGCGDVYPACNALARKMYVGCDG